jgi:hypothetical protein
MMASMRGHFAFVMLGLLAATPALAQVTMPAGQTFPRKLEADDLAPLPKAPQPVSGSVGVSASAAVSVTSPFVVKGVVVTLSGTTGFARDEALDKAARQALPAVLQALPMDAAKAAKTAKTLGNVMRFVSSYRVVKETVIPVYSLTADLTFNEAMLHKNFGGDVVVVSATTTTTAVSQSLLGPTADGGLVVAAGKAVPLNHWLVRTENSDPAEVSRLFEKLNSSEGMKATYRLVTSAGAEMVVDTALDMNTLQSLVGRDATVSALPETPMPQAAPFNGVY